MNQQVKQSGFAQSLLVAACIVIVIAGMHAAESILVPILLAAFISLLSAPLMLKMHKKGVPLVLAMLTVVGAILGILIGIVILVGTSLDEFSRNLPAYQLSLERQSQTMIEGLSTYGINLPADQVNKYFDPGIIFSLFGKLLGGLANIMRDGLLIFLTVIFMLGEASGLPGKLRLALGDKYHSEFFDKFTRNIQRYMGLKTIISMVTGILVWSWTSIMGVDYPLVWGFIAFLFNFVPNIGSIMAAVPALLLALIDLGLWPAVITAIGYIVINVTIGDLIEPRVLGSRLGLSTLIVFLSLVVWAWVLGPIGMFLSVPLTMTLKIALDSYEDTRWVAVLLGSDTDNIK